MKILSNKAVKIFSKALFASVLLVFLLIPFSSHALQQYTRSFNGTVTAIKKGVLTVSYLDTEVNADNPPTVSVTMTPSKPISGLKVGDNVSFDIQYKDDGTHSVLASSIKAGLDSTAKSGVGSSTDTSGTTTTFRLFPGLACKDSEAMTCWLKQVFEFSQTAILLLATAVIVFAGVIYMTSAGNPKQIEMSKKFILGALSGVAVIVLGKFFLITVVGVPLPWL